MSTRDNMNSNSKEKDIEMIVKNSIGESVTPANLLNSNRIGFIRRLLGHQAVEGPFTTDLCQNEQPHYLFHSTSGLSFPESEDEFQDEHFTFREASFVSPAVGMVTNQRSCFIYGDQDTRRVISVLHSDVIDIDYCDRKIEKNLCLRTVERQFTFGMWATDPYSSEMSDAAAYIFDKSDAEGGYQSYNFDTGEYSSARDLLKQNLRDMSQLTAELDIEYIATCAVKGAKIGAYRSPYAAVIGFTLGGGYALWAEYITQSHHRDFTNNIDPVKTAEEMLRWQQAGKTSNKKGMDLVGGVLGAAIAIDQQISGSQTSAILADLDMEWITQQLEAGNSQEAGLQVTTEVIKSYSDELAALIQEDFFYQLEQRE